MDKRFLGRSGIEVSALGVGCWAMGGRGWGGGADDQESIRGIHKALDMGVNFFDTADVYGFGHSERVLGQALVGRRDKAVIATKFTWTWDEATQTDTGPNISPAYIRSACEASLRRLQTDYLDLYQFHWNDYGPDGAENVREVLENLVRAGKIRSYGWSTDFADRARIFAAGKHCSAIQVELNVIDDSPHVLAVCEEFDLAAINRGPLAMGLLTGKYTPRHSLPEDDVRGPNAPDWMKYFKNGQPNPEWLDKASAVGEVLRSNGRTLAQGALAWLWARSSKNLPIPGFRTVAQVEENCGALAFGALNADQMRQIEEILQRSTTTA
ncbi:MAG: aldo/keto reductase [Chloroflexi bacterium CFX4]|nr:aldo/keto reductase [Chloroflexi bacterium CFX4]MDL1924036.1 aldo/keto reductase [Chloroflexi bacterium CFX3]